uniref:Gp9 protein n=1 Tax=uncultured bacterium Contig643 TaxID=1393602 RepID=W0FMR6_9BACT|nr:Gp9 protein [uncultured bacterium Contig643]
MSNFHLDATEADRLAEAMSQFEGASGRIIDDVLHGEGASRIKDKIAMLLPASGRDWKGKGASARAAMPGAFRQDNGQLSVTIAARGKYHYLYFPDDGSNTRKHAGNQQFMQRGGENAASEVIDLCIGKLTENF